MQPRCSLIPTLSLNVLCRTPRQPLRNGAKNFAPGPDTRSSHVRGLSLLVPIFCRGQFVIAFHSLQLAINRPHPLVPRGVAPQSGNAETLGISTYTMG